MLSSHYNQLCCFTLGTLQIKCSQTALFKDVAGTFNLVIMHKLTVTGTTKCLGIQGKVIQRLGTKVRVCVGTREEHEVQPSPLVALTGSRVAR